MRLSDLLDSRVYLSDGKEIGHVFDVRATARGSSRSTRAPGTLRVTHLLVGASALFSRLGYLHRSMKGPAGIPFLARHAKGYLVPWEQIERIESDRLTLSCAEDELEPIR